MGELHADYFRSASPKTFLEGPRKSGSDHQSDIVRLAGDIRMVVADEPKDKEVWDGERIKQVTGSKVTARGAYAKASGFELEKGWPARLRRRRRRQTRGVSWLGAVAMTLRDIGDIEDAKRLQEKVQACLALVVQPGEGQRRMSAG